jgi:hypothetical protein
MFCFPSVNCFLHSAIDLGEITVRDHLRRLVADTDFETGRAPVDELNCALGLECGNSLGSIPWNDITTVEQAGSHILSIAGITLDHLIVRLEARHGDLLGGVGLVRSLGGGDDWRVGDKREVNTGVWDEVGLELVQVDVERTIESKGCSNGRDDYSQLAIIRRAPPLIFNIP